MLEIVAHVVAGKGQHGEGVAPHHALRAGGGRRGFRAHGGGHVDALDPVARLRHQRHGGGAASAEDECVNRHALRVVPGRIQRGVVGGCHGEARVGMGGFGAGFAGQCGRPVFALPVDQVRGQAAAVFFHALPPDVAVVGQRHVGEDHVAVQTGHAVGVGVVVRAGGDTEIARFGVDGAHAAVHPGFDPGDVVANGADFPAREGGRWHQHAEVGLAAGAGKGGGDVVLAALRVGHAQDQHVFGQPARRTVVGGGAPHGGGDAQR